MGRENRYPPTPGFGSRIIDNTYQKSKFIDFLAFDVGFCKTPQELGITLPPFPAMYTDYTGGYWRQMDGKIPDNHQFKGKYFQGIYWPYRPDYRPQVTVKTTHAYDVPYDAQLPSTLSVRRARGEKI